MCRQASKAVSAGIYICVTKREVVGGGRWGEGGVSFDALVEGGRGSVVHLSCTCRALVASETAMRWVVFCIPFFFFLFSSLIDVLRDKSLLSFRVSRIFLPHSNHSGFSNDSSVMTAAEEDEEEKKAAIGGRELEGEGGVSEGGNGCWKIQWLSIFCCLCV